MERSHLGIAPVHSMQKGIGTWTLLVFGSLVGIVLYAAYRILPFYYSYYEVVNQMEQVIKVASTADNQEIRTKLIYHIKKLQIPVDFNALIIEREDRHMRISLPYEEVLDIEYDGKIHDLYVFKFNAFAEGDF